MKFRMASHILTTLTATVLCLSVLSHAASAQSSKPADTGEAFESPELSASFPDGEMTPTDSQKPKTTAPAPVGNNGSIAVTNPKGKTVQIPRDALWPSYLEWLSRQTGPESAVNSVELSGKVKGDRAVITATVTVQILRDGGWVRVPLYFNEAVIEKSVTRFLGDRTDKQSVPKSKKQDSAPKPPRGQSAFSGFTRQGGYRWWFQGKGYHRLALTLIVPVTKSVGQRRLRMSLPPLAAASKLQLQVNDPRITATGPKGTDVRVRKTGKSASEIVIVGMRDQLDLQWRTLPTKSGGREFLQAETAMLANITEESVEVKVLQRVQSTSALTKIQVEIPSGFRPVQAKGKFVQAMNFDAKTNHATVDFTEPRNEPTDITWVLEKPLPPRGGRIAIAGLTVDNADEQLVELAFAKIPGWRIEKLDSNDTTVRRLRLADFSGRSLVENIQLAGAYRLLRKPYQIAFQATPIQPHITATPFFQLRVSGKQILFEAEYRIRVSEEGGAVEEITIPWRDWKSAGWEIRPATASSLFQQQIPNGPNGNSNIRYRLAGRRRGDFVIPLQAMRAVKPGTNMAIQLPGITADIVHPAELLVSQSADVVLDLTDSEELPLTELTAKPAEGSLRRYQLDTTTTGLSAHVTVHPQSLKASTELDLIAKPGGLTSRQRIRLAIDYVPLSSLIVSVPSKLANQVRFYDADGQLAKTVAKGVKGGITEVEIRLLKPVLGATEITAVSSLSLPSELAPGDSANLTVPILGVPNIKYESMTVNSVSPSVIQVSTIDDQWKRIPGLDGAAHWAAQSQAKTFEVQLRNPVVASNLPFTVSRALIRVDVDHTGFAHIQAQYRLFKNPSHILLTLPTSCKLNGVWWNKDNVLAQVEQRRARGGVTLKIPAPSDNGDHTGGRLLTLDFHSPEFVRGDWIRNYDFSAPQFPGTVSVEHLVWDITVPRNQHLTSFSQQYFGEFRWMRDGLIWQRQPQHPFANTADWINAGDGPESSVPSAGNRYVFRRFGSSEGLQMRATSRSVLVFCGAGLAWLIGVILVRFPQLRNAVVLLTLLLIAAFCSLVFPTECQLLIQPAAVGLLLAGGFVWLDRRRRPAPSAAPMPVTMPDDFQLVTAGTPSERPSENVAVGSEDLTVVGAAHGEPASTTSGIRGQA